MGVQTDSFGVTDFVFRGTDVYAIGSKGLQIINVATHASPVLSKTIRTIKDGTGTKSIGYFTASILVEGNHMHYGGFNYYYIDISNLNDPAKIAERSYSGINSGSIQRLSSTKVVVGDGYDLHTMDVSVSPTIGKTAVSKLYGDPQQMIYDEPRKVLFTAFETSSQAFIYSVDMNTNLVLDSFNYRQVNGFDPSGHSGMFLFKDTLYVGTSLGVALFDVSNPADLRFLGKLTTGGSNAVYVNDEYLVTNDHYNLRFYRRGPASTTGAADQLELSTMELFPNPAQGESWLVFTQPAQPEIWLFDNAGKCVKQWQAQSISSEHRIPLAGVKPGIYHMQISSGTEVTRRKLVIR
jgi:hypothetical protein